MKTKRKPKALWTQMSNAKITKRPTMQQKRRAYALAAKSYLRIFSVCPISGRKATEVHHSRGRRGALLMDQRYWIPLSKAAHDWVHRNVKEARKMNWYGVPIMCALGKWNTP